MRATAGSRRSDGLEAALASEAPLRSRGADCVMSKSDTKDASRSSGLQQNRGIMRFHSARFTPPNLFVTDLDIGHAIGVLFGLCDHCAVRPGSGPAAQDVPVGGQAQARA